MNDLFILLGISSWKPYLSVFMLPPVPLLLLVLIGARLILPRRGLGWFITLMSVALLWLSMCGGTARLLSRMMLSNPPALSDARIAELKAVARAAAPTHEPVAIIVLGGGLRLRAPEYGGLGNLNDLSMERLRYGIWLSRQTGLPLGYTGGVGWGLPEATATPEAQMARRIAADEFKHPLTWYEDRSRDTRENASLTIAMLKPLGLQRIILVTHQVHMTRAVRNFTEAAQGSLQIEAAPVDLLNTGPMTSADWLPSRRGYSDVNMVLHEALGRMFGA